jgi:hypothetical protein
MAERESTRLRRELGLGPASQGQGPAEIAAANEITIEMARYRYNTTGVAKQVKHQPASGESQ